jgi:hypothetical protein
MESPKRLHFLGLLLTNSGTKLQEAPIRAYFTVFGGFLTSTFAVLLTSAICEDSMR